MSSINYLHTLNPAPSARLQELVERLLAVDDGGWLRKGADPIALAGRAGLSVAEGLAALGVLTLAGVGQLVVRVLNARGQTIREFAASEAVPEEITDDYGVVQVIDPSDTRLLFVATAQGDSRAS